MAVGRMVCGEGLVGAGRGGNLSVQQVMTAGTWDSAKHLWRTSNSVAGPWCAAWLPSRVGGASLECDRLAACASLAHLGQPPASPSRLKSHPWRQSGHTFQVGAVEHTFKPTRSPHHGPHIHPGRFGHCLADSAACVHPSRDPGALRGRL